MFRVNLTAPTSGVTVNAAALTMGVCLTDEIAVLVGNTVPRYRCGSELRETLKAWALKPRDPIAVAIGSVRAFVAAPVPTGDALDATGATVLNAAVPDETQVGVVVGANAAALLDRSSLLDAAIKRAIDGFVANLGM